VVGTRQRQRREHSVRLRLRLSRMWTGRTCALSRGLEGHLCVQAACKPSGKPASSPSQTTVSKRLCVLDGDRALTSQLITDSEFLHLDSIVFAVSFNL
jgi:hypothetical protein